MTHLIAVLLLAGSVFSTVAVAQSNAPVPVLPDTLRGESAERLGVTSSLGSRR